MGYYCTVPQCTSLAGKTKNVKFHRFPRDVAMADKWNVILKRGKPYTKYSKVCSLHFTQQDYNVTTMGQWKTLSKDAVPSQNLPRCNPDGTPMVIRKSRTVKCKQTLIKKELDLGCDKTEDKWPHTSAAILHNMASAIHDPAALHSSAIHETALVYNRIQQSLTSLAQQQHHQQSTSSSSSSLNTSNNNGVERGIEKADATQQTEPLRDDDDRRIDYSDAEDSYDPIEPFSGQGTSTQFQKSNQTYNRRDYGIPKDYTKNAEEFLKSEYNKSSSFNKNSNEYPSKSSSDYDKSTTSPDFGKGGQDFGKGGQDFGKGSQDFGKGGQEFGKGHQDFGKSEDFLPQTNEEYNKEAEKYALERKSHFDKLDSGYHKTFPTYPKIQDVYSEYNREYPEKTAEYPRYHEYQNGFQDVAGHSLSLLHEQHRLGENPGFFSEPHIKQEIDLSGDDDKYLYERSKEALEASSMYEQQRLMQQRLLDHVKTEPDATSGCDAVMQAQSSPYYQNGHNNISGGYYQQYARQPLGPELLIAKQNALAAHSQLWQNTMKRPFFYSESPHYNGTPLLQRYEDLTRISQ